MRTIVHRGLAWVQAQLAKLKARQEAVEAEYRRKQEAANRINLSAAPKPRPPAVVTERARRRRALIVGINGYARSPLRGCEADARRWTSVHRLGAVNDALAWAELLKAPVVRGGWDTTVMLEREATQDDVFGLLRRWAIEAEPGDEIAFTFSGHGTRLPDLNDPTGEVAAIVFADALDRSDPSWFADRCGTHLEFAAIVREMADGVRFNALIDACHSGIPRESLEAARRARAVANLLGNQAPYRVARYLEPPQGTLPAAGSLRTLDGGSRAVVAVEDLRTLLVSGCAPEQTSADAKIRGVFCGAASEHVLSAYAAASDAPISLLIDGACQSLKRDGYDQVPWLHGSKTRRAAPAWWRPRP